MYDHERAGKGGACMTMISQTREAVARGMRNSHPNVFSKIVVLKMRKVSLKYIYDGKNAANLT